ncbi:nitrate reductase molybdenum cofactor assembly chaperone [Vandammella animalimorsus]|uniref:Nitrate reductase molybdenum cofactor assembly chaperone n=1 Tax=Vandammella animalimorsus TaxID=2029117 RepID=A0A2A2ALI1_9BURK|nr:nitrate reductase molybdenum cofactor assembly chaperone [Vandammella animalimorsus]PAT38603.1 nitrate reductase molybdenum cofactor assembly chaperone [Vandammella animalimorsus]
MAQTLHAPAQDARAQDARAEADTALLQTPANPLYKWCSALLCYPEAELIEALPQLRAMLAGWPELQAHHAALHGLLDHLQGRSLRQLQEAYVRTFDHNRQHALYIFEYVYGEDRDRGSAMVDLLEEYRQHGFELGDEELPDYLPALLEYFSHVPDAHARKLLGDLVHVVAHIATRLHASGSPYAAVLDALVALSPVAPQPLVEPPVRDMDEAMETFGPDAAGLEPLLKPSLESTIQFYPKAAVAAGRKPAQAS